jgi:3-oxoadipate enol-lactonase
MFPIVDREPMMPSVLAVGQVGTTRRTTGRIRARRCLRIGWLAVGLGTGLLAVGAREAAADRLTVPGSHLYYEVHGEGRPLVLIHGGNLDAGMWDADVPVLARSFRVITYDVRPYGRSGPATPDYAWHEDLRALLDHLRVERADLVGLSLGARLAINFALAYPSRVDRLVLAGPGVDGWPFAPDPHLRGLIGAVIARDAKKATALWLAHPYMATAMRDPGVATRLRGLAARNEHIWSQEIGPAVVPKPLALNRAAEIRAPTLILVGTLDVADIVQIADRLERDIRGARKVVLPEIGHLVNLEAPDRFRALVTDFLSGR